MRGVSRGVRGRHTFGIVGNPHAERFDREAGYASERGARARWPNQTTKSRARDSLILSRY